MNKVFFYFFLKYNQCNSICKTRNHHSNGDGNNKNVHSDDGDDSNYKCG